MFGLPLKVADLMRDFEPKWFVAGGWALDLYLEKETRVHTDIEVAIFRRDQLMLQKYLDGWLLKKAENGALPVWHQDEFLELPIHEIHCFNEKAEPPVLEVLLNETAGKDWIFRRNKAITKPLSTFYRTSNSGINFLAPEVILLYKSKNPRAKDEKDFRLVVPHLDVESKNWLRNAVSACNCKHHWLESL